MPRQISPPNLAGWDQYSADPSLSAPRTDSSPRDARSELPALGIWDDTLVSCHSAALKGCAVPGEGAGQQAQRPGDPIPQPD